MPFITARAPDTDTFLLGSHTDYLNVWASVHDEADFTVPVFLRDAVMKFVTNEGSLKELLDKYKLAGLAMSYDVEWDRFGTWTASDNTNIYEYPLHHEEQEAFSLWQDSKDLKLRPNVQTSTEGRIIKQPLHLASPEWMANLNSLPDGPDKVLIQTGEDDFFEYERKVEFTPPPE